MSVAGEGHRSSSRTNLHFSASQVASADIYYAIDYLKAVGGLITPVTEPCHWGGSNSV